ncbi:type II toxin-antitoxin system Phd/YefM family antitoxin [Crocosphaera sp. XPORK-15E]|uniref:type II toxin-antitoxin system Phd/YefM family antitoxin n=1 Tax=Crocosphaera sp. XPORK-15E TaxID=3110247 RepID=UPI002B214AAB|nr:type II toxin-antitoxin system Phd/YefM family antitoxin [Crocosphaera sp. XPORK-15E]MEA5535454.1 type II toxin-antitoxin system Phd/YefM family antitoxin [Crocosphaera sp. XPORK-15E]
MFSYEITSPTEARNGLFQLLEKVAEDHQVFIINRRHGENVALIAESDLRSLVETLEELKQELGIEQEDE